MSGVWPLMIVEVDPATHASLGLRTGVPGVQVDAFILQRPPQTLDEDVVDAAPLAVHGDAHAGPLEGVDPGEGRELAALIGVHDLWRAEPVERLVQRLHAEPRLQRVGDAPGEHLAGMPVHDSELQYRFPTGNRGSADI